MEKTDPLGAKPSRMYGRVIGGAILVVLLLLAMTVRLDRLPPLWWDEGWTLTVARTWVERGHYGLLNEGRFAPPELAANFPIVAPIALSFRLFGVGVWQGRFVIALFSLATLALLHYLARRLYNRPVANATLFVLLLMPIYQGLHPVYIGRQVLAEMPMLFYALAGYACLLSALRRPLLFMPPTILLWSLALRAKAQPLPFWAASMIVPLLVTLLKRRWREAGLLGLALFGSYGGSRLLPWLRDLLLQGHTLPATPISGVREFTAIVPSLSIRLEALFVTLTAGFPSLLGLTYTAWRWLKRPDKLETEPERAIMRLSLLSLAGSWLGWFILLSAGWFRYLFPVTFVGSMFVAALLHDLSDGFDLLAVLRRAGSALRRLRLDRPAAKAFLTIFLVGLSLPFDLISLGDLFLSADDSVYQVAEFLNTQIPPDALIESYDTELFFLLDRPYHYPPPQMHVDLMRKGFLQQDVSIEYDPLPADPDYLVIGEYGRNAASGALYSPVLSAGEFCLVQSYGEYDIYERVR
jgi:4-amino-4-deoxy-L-arabinose transferase-like glycosyltransferase